MAPPAADTRALNELIASTLALLKQFPSSLSPSNMTSATTIANPPNPLQVLRDSATLLKAHTTKVSLLAINKPFTPSAITKILLDLSGTCLPAIMSAVQVCEQEKSTWGSLMGKEIGVRILRTFKEMENLLAELKSIADGNSAPARRDSLSSTGVVWESCDALIELEKVGIAGLAVKKAEQYRDSIKDAIEELQEWREGSDPDNEGQADELLDSDDEGVDGDAESLDDIFNAANSMPKDRPELRQLVEEAEGKLKKIVLLHTALVKRRLKTFKASEQAHVEALDAILLHLKTAQSGVDDLAGSFYDLDDNGAKSELAKCVDEAKSACTIARLSWEGKEDEFTAWSKKWEEAIG
ncbi:hypothetical protein M409DRAFT_65782 [Zasmidium cellare ATCC 36951]|uniref:Uncharacterized protein n=1 Tax=Zasmidium cellare ATCC 36951 TaxID=1080233 RepID=A0A6A6CPF7_ZASCE|nr:uncharacterized protein M409DRAFT_65782 [Zasmidium cellare ATCC 36951]KAF2167639.1 hypothetical protein M409DRAFT_65782 [Zasmidium cellare ATCC 36951]